MGKIQHLVLTGGLAMASASIRAEAPASRPNIIFILVDDLGKEWVSCYGAENIHTPNIDQLAETGVRFENVYSMPQCTPSRACFMTGQYPFRNGWVNHWDVPRWGVGYFDWQKNPSIARVMKSGGYKTAVAGKWQLNDFREDPDAMIRHGFDEYCMWTGGESSLEDEDHEAVTDRRYWDPYIHTKDGSRTYVGQFGPDIFNQFLLDFISENKDAPFFVYYPMVLTHVPFTTTPHEPDATGNYGQHKAMVRYTDYLVGRLAQHLDELGIREKTLVVFTSDNGTVSSLTNSMKGRDVTGGKSKTTENGINAPFVVNCPGMVPQGVVSDALIDFTDLLPTFADFAGTQPEPGFVYDGFSARDVFLGFAKKTDREWILAMGGHPGVATDQGIENVYCFRDRVIRGVRYKLFVGTDRRPEKLVDLLNDPEEKVNLMGNPEYNSVFKQLAGVIGLLPNKDRDPLYTHRPDYPHFITPTNPTLSDPRKSQKHKIGYSTNE